MGQPFSIFLGAAPGSRYNPSMRKTVMIFGVSSFLGSNLLEALRGDFRVVGTFHDNPVNVPGILTLRCDVHKKENVSRLVAMVQPHVTIYAAGLSSVVASHANPKLADALNSAGLINVCSAAERYGSKFMFFSSSFVLGGEDVLYKESDTPFPFTVYGGTLASSEFYVQKSCLNYVVFRCCPLYGRGTHPTRRNWWEALESSVARGLPLSLDDHVLHGHLDVQLLSRLVRSAILENVTNRLFHVSSRDVMTRHDFGKTYCRIFEKDENLVARAQWELPVSESAMRGGRIPEKPCFRLETKNAEEFFNVRFPSVEESLESTKKRLTG